MEKLKSLKIYIFAVITVVCWGMSFAGAKVALAELSPLMVMFMRFALSLIILVPVAYFYGELRLPTKKEAAVLAFMGFMGFFFHIGIQTIAMKTSGSANANWQMAAAPALSAALAALLLKEKLRAQQIAGIVLAFIGVAIVLSHGTQGSRGFSSYNFGDFLISLSVLNWAAFMVLTRWLFKKDKYPPVFTILWEIFFAVLMSLPVLAVTRTDVTVLARLSPEVWAALALLGFFCSGLAYVFWYIAAAGIPVARLMVFQFFQPVVGVAAGYFMVGERFTIWLFISGAMILLGVWTVNAKGHAGRESSDE